MDHNLSALDGHTATQPMHMTPKQESQARAIVNKLPRPDLEDKYLRSQEENIILKRHVRKQEDKIKRISTKLIRLVNDRKKWSSEARQTGKRTTREVSLEETIETQQDAIRKLEKDNEMLKQKLHVVNQQMLTQGRRHTPYGHVQSRVNSGIERRPVSARDRPKPGMRAKSPGHDSMAASGSRYGHSLLEEAREENRRMQNMIIGLQEQLVNMERENGKLQQELRLKDAEQEDNLLKFKEQMNSTKKITVSENIELIRLRREIKEKSLAFESMQTKYRELQDTQHNVRKTYDKVLNELGHVKSKLMEEEKKSFTLQNQIKHGPRSDLKSAELKQTIYDLEREVEILKDANERLTNNAFAAEQEQKWRRVEYDLRKQIAQLEAVVQHDLKDKDSVLQRAASERNMKDRMHDETRRLHEECVRLRTDNEDLRNRMRLVTALDDAVSATELEEALSVIRQKRHLASERKRPDFLEDDHESKDLDTLYNDLQVQHADTIQELEKTREMLLMQHRINKDYQIEVDSVSRKMEEMKREYESKLEHYAQLLDARAARIKKLEKQLHDVAYGTKQFKIDTQDEEMDVEEEDFDITKLERGENLLEINIQKAMLSHDALQAMEDREPSTFITYEFFDFEIVSTPIIKSGSPRFDFTSQYIVKVDDLFLYHLQKNSTRIELHQAFGTEYRTVCGCTIRLNQLLDKPQGKLHGSAVLTGSSDGANYGTLDFWVRLRVPMDQAIRLYKERTKALGYLSANSAATQKQLDTSLTLQRQDENFNQLEVRIMSCNHVQARRPGVQPNVYCVYKFYDFADHDTVIIPNTNNPHFDDIQYFPVQMSADLDAYLKSEKLTVYVFDDGDPDMTSYLGKANVDMIPIAHDKMIKAPFQLYSPDDTENGTIELSLRWKLSYKAPLNVMRIPETETERLEKQRKVEDQMIPEKLIAPIIIKPKERQKPKQKQTKVVRRLSSPKSDSPKKVVKETQPIPDQIPTTAPRNTIPPQKISTIKTKLGQLDDGGSKEEPSLAASETESEPMSEIMEIKAGSTTGTSGEKPKPKTRTIKKTLSMDATDELPRKDNVGVEETTVKSASPPPKTRGETDEFTRKENIQIEEENQVTLVKPLSTLSGTPEESEVEEDIEEDIEDIHNSEDSGSVVMSSFNDTQETPETIRITVNHLSLYPDGWVFKDNDIQKLFVEYAFLGRVEETPVSLPKPKDASRDMSYNFCKVTHVDAKKNEQNRNHVAAMILPTKEVDSKISFTVVSEPTYDDDDCDELGTAAVDLKEILKNEQDIIQTDIEVMSRLDETNPIAIGRINVSVEAVDALKSIVNEVQDLLDKSMK